jgi:transcriptional regulator with XRE-family HTH domain
MNYFAKNLRFLRKQSRVTQHQLALQVNKGQTTVGNWENEISEPSMDELIIVSNYFGISITDFLIEDAEKGNLIGKNDVFTDPPKNRQKGNLKGNLMGNLMTEKDAFYGSGNSPNNQLNEAKDSAIWLLLQEQKRISEKLDNVAENVRFIRDSGLKGG